MTDFLGRFKPSDRKGDWVFVAVFAAAYLSAALYMRKSFSTLELSALVVSSVVYLGVGVFGYRRCKQVGTLRNALLYFAFQIPLAALIVSLTNAGFIMLVFLPLAGQAVVLLPHRWMLLVCGVILAARVVPSYLSFGARAALTIGLVFLAMLVFVVVVAQTAVAEQHARAEVERLAAELTEANSKLREYAAQVEELATARERNRIAREIHDGLGHYLTGINIQLEAARAVLDHDPDKARDATAKAQSLAREGLADVRQSVAALRTVEPKNRPLAESVAELVEQCRASGIRTELIVSGEPRSLPPPVELTLYRGAQEGLTNVRKHAEASQTDVVLDFQEPESVRLVVRDDGRGGNESNGGFGLLGIRERVSLLNGNVSTRAEIGKGFLLEIVLPG